VRLELDVELPGIGHEDRKQPKERHAVDSPAAPHSLHGERVRVASQITAASWPLQIAATDGIREVSWGDARVPQLLSSEDGARDVRRESGCR
jgi:hypothetical protein